MHIHQGVALLDGIRKVKRRGLGGSMSLGKNLEVSKAHAKPIVFLSAHGSGSGSQSLHWCLPDVGMLPDIMIMD